MELCFVGSFTNRRQEGDAIARRVSRRTPSTSCNKLQANVPNPFAGLTPSSAINDLRGTNTRRFRLLRPFPQFDQVNTTTNEGYSWYHSLQASLNKRFSRGYTLGLNYTFSKFMEATELLNGDDPRPVEIISASDRPHRFTLSGIYEFPFGKGRKFFADAGKAASLFISGWQISTVYQLQSGVPLQFGDVIYNGDVRNIALPGDQQAPQRWFNNAGFVALRERLPDGTFRIVRNASGAPVLVDYNDPCKNSYNATSCPGAPLANPLGFNRDADLQFASHVRTFPLRFGFLRSDQINNIDFSLTKKTEILENKNLEFRADLLNAFNHVLFPGPVVVPTNNAFGQIVASNQANYSRRVQLTLKFTF